MQDNLQNQRKIVRFFQKKVGDEVRYVQESLKCRRCRKSSPINQITLDRKNFKLTFCLFLHHDRICITFKGKIQKKE